MQTFLWRKLVNQAKQQKKITISSRLGTLIFRISNVLTSYLVLRGEYTDMSACPARLHAPRLHRGAGKFCDCQDKLRTRAQAPCTHARPLQCSFNN